MAFYLLIDVGVDETLHWSGNMFQQNGSLCPVLYRKGLPQRWQLFSRHTTVLLHQRSLKDLCLIIVLSQYDCTYIQQNIFKIFKKIKINIVISIQKILPWFCIINNVLCVICYIMNFIIRNKCFDDICQYFFNINNKNDNKRSTNLSLVN